MDRTTITAFFQELGKELEQLAVTQPVRLFVFGGAYHVVHVGNRSATEDIDVILLDHQDTFADPLTDKVTRTFKKAASTIARRHQMKRHWLNDDAAIFMRDYLHAPEFQEFCTFGPLQVLFPTSECGLAIKLLIYRPKDYSDVDALLEQVGIETREQAQALLDRFIPDHRWQDEYNVEQTLREFFG
ncbi:hypothetical protein KSX_65520 [Ktedonospora formicarum]|uniref:Nucleotidyltransferase n=2 Tax=Ktedonospora formicarum TaxID=2778364 RepID=A0A8J3I310_9CHLR|nr:hypothetical protein KSX_65520 [Ktedonospora formicarum]